MLIILLFAEVSTLAAVYLLLGVSAFSTVAKFNTYMCFSGYLSNTVFL